MQEEKTEDRRTCPPWDRGQADQPSLRQRTGGPALPGTEDRRTGPPSTYRVTRLHRVIQFVGSNPLIWITTMTVGSIQVPWVTEVGNFES